MDPVTAGIVLEVVRGVRAGLGWLIAKRGGDTNAALQIIRQYQGTRDTSVFGPDIADALGMAAHGLAFLTARGLVVDDLKELLDLAETEGRDLTDEEVLGAFAATDEVADRVEDLVAELENEEAAGGENSSGEEAAGGSLDEESTTTPGEDEAPAAP